MSYDMSKRCPRCLMFAPLCICSLIPRITTSTKVIIVVSKREERAATNTGRLVALSLENSILLVRGDLDRPYDLRDHLTPRRPSYLLYPCPEAAELSTAFATTIPRPINLIVPDGNWRQTVKMCRRDPQMALLPRIKLPTGMISNYGVRTERKEGGLATLEAIARILGILENTHIRDQLEELMQHMVQRTLSRRRNKII